MIGGNHFSQKQNKANEREERPISIGTLSLTAKMHFKGSGLPTDSHVETRLSRKLSWQRILLQVCNFVSCRFTLFPTPGEREHLECGISYKVSRNLIPCHYNSRISQNKRVKYTKRTICFQYKQLKLKLLNLWPISLKRATPVNTYTLYKTTLCFSNTISRYKHVKYTKRII